MRRATKRTITSSPKSSYNESNSRKKNKQTVSLKPKNHDWHIPQEKPSSLWLGIEEKQCQVENLGWNPTKVSEKTVKTEKSSRSPVCVYGIKYGMWNVGRAECWNRKKQEPGDPARLLLRHEVMKRLEKHQTGKLQIKGESWIKTSALRHKQIYN